MEFSQAEDSLTEWLEDAIQGGHINEYDYKEFTDFAKIGEGEFGNVHKVWWKTHELIVALKCLKNDKNPRIIEELKILQRISFHPNIIEFYGVTKNSFGCHNIVMQFAEDGNLRQYLKVKFSKLEWVDKARMAREITLGLEFLHKLDVVHLDLHTGNILVHEGKMMIADFGFSVYMEDLDSSRGIYGNPAFIDPQLFNDFSYRLNKKSDIYSLGVIFWEIASCQVPFQTESVKKIVFLISQGKREISIKNMPLRYIELYEHCWDEDLANRPELNVVLSVLEQLIYNKDLYTPINSNYSNSLDQQYIFIGKPLYLINSSKVNDMELFYFLTGGPHHIDHARNILIKNMNAIEDLILHKKFIPFPPKLSKPEEYPPKDEFVNNRQLNVIARAILICKELVSMWKEVGYYEICNDVNDLVMQGALLILFPSMPSAEWIQPNVNIIDERLTELIDLGFNLDYKVISNILYLFETRLSDIGKILAESFKVIKDESHENFLFYCLIESIRPERNLNKPYVWNFLYTLAQNNPEAIFNNAIDYYWNNKFCLLPLKLYEWILMKFGPDVQITRRCFENILKIYVSIDQQIQGFNVDIPLGMSRTPFQEICDIFKTYCNTKNFFLPSHLDIVTQCINVEILIPLFKYYLPKLFNVEMTFVMPKQIIEVADNANHNTDIIQKSSTKKKENKLILEEWKQVLYNISISDESRSDVFQDYFREFIAKLPTSEFVIRK